MVQCLWFSVYGLGFMVYDSGFRIQVLGFRDGLWHVIIQTRVSVKGLGSRVEGRIMAWDRRSSS